MKYSFLLFILALLMCSVSAQAQVQRINTIAGNGIEGYSGDGHSADAAQLFGPIGVAVDNAGGVFIADYYNNRIRKVNASGIITTIAGNGSFGDAGDGSISTSAELTPYSIAIDKLGNIYMSDANFGVVRKINTLSIISTIAGNKVFGYNGDNIPAIDASLSQPSGLAVDNAGNVFIADAGNHVIRKVDAAGTITTYAGTDTVSGYYGDTGLADTAKLDSPYAVAVDKKGNLYINDFGNNVIRKVDTGHIITTYAGIAGNYGYFGDGGSATNAKLYHPKGIAVDTFGNLYIADAVNNVIRMVDTNDIITTVAGNGTVGFGGDLGFANGANLHNPYAVAVDYYGSIYIADANNERVRKTYYYSTAGVNNTPVLANIEMHPNPFNHEITVSGLNASDKVSLCDITGRQVSEVWEVASDGVQTFAVNDLAPGLYLLQVWNSAGNKKATLQMVKE